jgi:mannose-6-phosphate isomerase class I
VSYDAEPCYPVVDGQVRVGYASLADRLTAHRPHVVAVDGPAVAAWELFSGSLTDALREAGISCRCVDARRRMAPWEEVQRRTAASELPGDPVFARVWNGALEDLFDGLSEPVLSPEADVTVVYGPGSGLLPHDALWYADVPKRLALEAVRQRRAGNVGQPPGEAGSEQRLLFIDWPLLDRHKQQLAGRLDAFLDLTDPATPRWIDGGGLRRSLHALAGRPFRTRPTFLPGPWGGQWLRRTLGVETSDPNLAWSYELITPESGILLGSGERLEVGFELLMAENAEAVLGPRVAARFGRSFPVRFDYLDTLEGGDLSIQVHPSDDYMRRTFGLPYTQHESYYVMTTTPEARIFLGLRDDADIEQFQADARRAEQPGVAFPPERYLQAHAAEQHRLYLIPAGTPHASGAGNVVLEISATPYLYTLRFYDWLRRDLAGQLRPVHVAHAFANLDSSRRGDAVGALIPQPTILRNGPGWAELVLGRTPELFFAVHRLDFDETVEDATGGQFHALNLVGGDEVVIETAVADHPLAYAESIVIPAAVGRYRVRRRSGGRCRLIKAFVL